MIPLLLFLALLIIGITTDVRARRVPNVLVLAMLVLASVGALMTWSPAGSMVRAMWGMLVGLAMWLPFWLLGLLGAGDVKYFAAASAWIGAPLAWRAALVAAVLGGVMGILLLIRQRGFRRTASDVMLQYQQASTLIASADVATADAKARTFPYALPMGLALGTAAVSPRLFLQW
jgi:prepilin peptidase CpaA